jgi:hypothetical protein
VVSTEASSTLIQATRNASRARQRKCSTQSIENSNPGIIGKFLRITKACHGAAVGLGPRCGDATPGGSMRTRWPVCIAPCVQKLPMPNSVQSICRGRQSHENPIGRVCLSHEGTRPWNHPCRSSRTRGAAPGGALPLADRQIHRSCPVAICPVEMIGTGSFI